MIETKFFSPRIDEKSLMESYDYDYIAKAQEVFGITDFWATYSWGFHPSIEQEDYDFILSRLQNFHKLGIKVHAYIQGPNVVTSGFADKQWYAKDHKKRRISYYRSRDMVCLNSQEYIDFTAQKILSLKDSGFAGIFIDNIQMGQLGMPLYYKNRPFVFAGCTCEVCQKKFLDMSGTHIPTDFEKDPDITSEYLKFRVDSTTSFVKELKQVSKSIGMQFGVNTFDPKKENEYVYGSSLTALEPHLDYILIENHSFPDRSGGIGNRYIQKFAMNLTTPLYVLPYKIGIGYDKEYSQNDFSLQLSEAEHLHVNPMIKGSEYTSGGIWHNLTVANMSPIQYQKNVKLSTLKNVAKKSLSLLHIPGVRSLIKDNYNLSYRMFMESRVVRDSFSWAYPLAVG
jgi:hypothetical protein